MRITAIPVSGGQGVVLGDDAAKEYIVGGEPQREQQVQEANLAFGEEIYRKVLGNKRTVVEWTVSRCHASQQAAFDFAWDHADALPAENVHLKIESNGSTRWLSNAALRAVNLSDRLTKSTKFRYSVVGGVVSAVDPTV